MKATEEQRAERHRECNRKDYYKNRKKRMAASKEHRRKHPEAASENSRQYRLRARMACLEYYSRGSPRCACCGESHIEFLVIDHINGGGNTYICIHICVRQASAPHVYACVSVFGCVCLALEIQVEHVIAVLAWSSLT